MVTRRPPSCYRAARPRLLRSREQERAGEALVPGAPDPAAASRLSRACCAPGNLACLTSPGPDSGLGCRYKYSKLLNRRRGREKQTSAASLPRSNLTQRAEPTPSRGHSLSLSLSRARALSLPIFRFLSLSLSLSLSMPFALCLLSLSHYLSLCLPHCMSRSLWRTPAYPATPHRRDTRRADVGSEMGPAACRRGWGDVARDRTRCGGGSYSGLSSNASRTRHEKGMLSRDRLRVSRDTGRLMSRDTARLTDATRERRTLHLHPTPYTLHPIPYTLYPEPYTPHPTP